ncbi:uncharacterized protein LOC142219942 isoform X3 [Haematobia irritans]|uniref:uncharacterized protein LOC142219942 isoform X3 n=1 Tax=Haematobia irritans TaxID=7368 RepID=UPI003F4FA51F
MTKDAHSLHFEISKTQTLLLTISFKIRKRISKVIFQTDTYCWHLQMKNRYCVTP